MFKNTYISGYLSVFYSVGTEPLELWSVKDLGGKVKLKNDEELQSQVLEIKCFATRDLPDCYITCPADPNTTLGIKLPLLVLIVKDLQSYFSFEVEVIDDKKETRRFRSSNFQPIAKVKPFICSMPLQLDGGWNQITLNLQEFVSRAYGTQYVETSRLTIHANCRVRRIFFEETLIPEDSLPPEFKLYKPN